MFLQSASFAPRRPCAGWRLFVCWRCWVRFDVVCHDDTIMKAGSIDALAQRRLGRAGPSAPERALLRAATLQGDAAASAWRHWAASNHIDDTATYAVELLPAVSSNVSGDVLGDEAGRLRGLRRRVWVEQQNQSRRTQRSIEALGSAGIVPIITGGAALATTVFAAAGTRPWGPLSLVIGDADIDSAAVALRLAGWVSPSRTSGPFDHVVTLADAATDTTSHTLRLQPWVLFPSVVGVPERRWEQRSVTHELLGCPVRRLRMSDELVATIITGLWSQSATSARWPLDAVYVVRHGPPVDQVCVADFWREVVASAVEASVGPLLADALEWCRTELDAPVPANVVAELAASPLDRHVARHWALRRRGITPEWRALRYRRWCLARNERPTPLGYARARCAVLAAKGVGASVDERAIRAKKFVSNQWRG